MNNKTRDLKIGTCATIATGMALPIAKFAPNATSILAPIAISSLGRNKLESTAIGLVGYAICRMSKRKGNKIVPGLMLGIGIYKTCDNLATQWMAQYDVDVVQYYNKKMAEAKGVAQPTSQPQIQPTSDIPINADTSSASAADIPVPADTPAQAEVPPKERDIWDHFPMGISEPQKEMIAKDYNLLLKQLKEGAKEDEKDLIKETFISSLTPENKQEAIIILEEMLRQMKEQGYSTIHDKPEVPSKPSNRRIMFQEVLVLAEKYGVTPVYLVDKLRSAQSTKDIPNALKRPSLKTKWDYNDTVKELWDKGILNIPDAIAEAEKRIKESKV